MLSIERDSVKDETVVVLFIFMTAGLLGWAVIQPWIDKFRDAPYTPSNLPSSNNQQNGARVGGRSG